jgi:hypothetical protein
LSDTFLQAHESTQRGFRAYDANPGV